MKRKHLVLYGLLFVGVCVGLIMYVKPSALFPSQQMKELRILEDSLDLPEPKYRNEEDGGKSKDWKGVTRYERHIALSYQDASVLSELRSKLLARSWTEETGDKIASYSYFSFKKGSGDEQRCINGYTQPANSDGIVLYISLQASGEYACTPT